MKKLLLATALLSTATFTGAASAEVSGNIGATSNYIWRGVTQTADDVAVQGGIDYEHESGFYVGTWASNVDFGDDTTYELDFYAGYGGSFAEDFTYDISYVYYAYPDADSSYDFGEATFALGWKWLEVSYSQILNTQSDVSGAEDDTDWKYLQANLSFPLTEKLSLGLHYGYSSGDVVKDLMEDTYADYNISLSAETDLGTVSFMVSDTDIEGDDAKVIVGYSYSFGL